MTKKTRTVLFLIFLTFFLLAAPLAIFYSQGYRIDIDSKRITQTGGLFLKIEPKQVEIYIDGELKKKTDFFFGSALIENLLPGKYKIEIKKEGYHPWEKFLEVREKEVTEAKNIVLFPENLKFEILTPHQRDGGGVENSWLSPDEKKMVLKEAEDGNWVLKLYDLERNIKSRLIGEKDIYKEVDLLDLKFSEDSKEIYLDIGMKEQEKNFTLNLNKIPPTLTERKLAPLSENILTSQTINNKIYYLDDFGNLFKDGERLNEKPFPVKSETEYALEIFQDFIFLREGQTLYQFNPDSKSFEKFFDDIKDFKISPDNKKLVYFSDSEIWIFFLKDYNPPTTHRKGDRVFLVRFSEEINDVFWLNSDYLIFNTGNKIKIAEIDDRDKINIVDIAEFEKPPQGNKLPAGQAKIFWNSVEKKLYVLSEGNLYRSTVLLP